MVKRSALAVILASLSITAPSFVSAENPIRVLRITTELVCPSTKADLIKWAGRTEGYAAMAVPVTPTANASCTTRVTAGNAWGYENQASAVDAAKAKCLTTMPAGAIGCKVIAVGFDQKE